MNRPRDTSALPGRNAKRNADPGAHTRNRRWSLNRGADDAQRGAWTRRTPPDPGAAGSPAPRRILNGCLAAEPSPVRARGDELVHRRRGDAAVADAWAAERNSHFAAGPFVAETAAGFEMSPVPKTEDRSTCRVDALTAGSRAPRRPRARRASRARRVPYQPHVGQVGRRPHTPPASGRSSGLPVFPRLVGVAFSAPPRGADLAWLPANPPAWSWRIPSALSTGEGSHA